jgi:catechol 2,3-dioxygenase-like lactoylglutathione lyase family enzyme
MTIALPPLLHVGLVVADMDAASADFERRWGVATERRMDLTPEWATYRGETVAFSARYGFLRSGASEVELIQPLTGSSPYADFLQENGGDGIHHLAYVVDAIDPYLEQLRATDGDVAILLDAGLPGGGRFTYVEGAAHGTVVELIELPPSA